MEQIIERFQSPQMHAGLLVLAIVVAMLWIGKRIRANNHDDDDDSGDAFDLGHACGKPD